MLILGIGSLLNHDPSAAIIVDGKIVAAAEEERFIREKHAEGKLPLEAARFCLKQAGVEAKDVDVVAVPWSEDAYRRHMWRYARRTARSKPSHAWKAIFKASERNRQKREWLFSMLDELGIDRSKTRIEWVEHHLAHASSAFHLSGFEEAAILSIDGKGEFTATMVARGRGRDIEIVEEILNPDSLGLFFATVTEFLGFRNNDGEFKVMGMASYGDASKYDLSSMLTQDPAHGTYRVNEELVWVRKALRVGGKRYSQAVIDLLGEPREGDELLEPYIHIAAATQKVLEDVAVNLLETHLKDDLERHGTLCLAGGCALNVRMNQILLEHPLVKRVFVQPASNDAGVALGAASYVAAREGEPLEAMRHAYLGPEYDAGVCRRALEAAGLRIEEPPDIVERAAELLDQGEVISWCQGRMEFGPRALGNRSILGNPSTPGIADKINLAVKFREKWRPFCPSVLDDAAAEVLGSTHPAQFMTISFTAQPAWKERIPEAVHVDGTVRPQVVSADTNPTYHRLLSTFRKRSGLPVVINTSLNRRGEPMVCSPEDAVRMFLGCGLEHLACGPYLATKQDP